jgi:Holliday junction resolvase RusA-like endonuclease
MIGPGQLAPIGYQFEVYGTPLPQAYKVGRGRIYNGNARWKEQIRWQIKPLAPEEPLTGPIELTTVFFLPIPKRAAKLARQQMINRVILPSIKPDASNLDYLVENALTGLVYVDDQQVCAKHVYKFYGVTPKTVIKVRPICTYEPVGLAECG